MTNNLKATKRDSKTAGELVSLRSKGLIPAILYGGDNPNLKISVDDQLEIQRIFFPIKFLIQTHFFQQ